MREAKITFYLKSVKSDSKPVILKFNFGYKEVDPINKRTKYFPLRYNTGVKLEKANWNKEENYPKLQKDITKIESVKETAINTYRYLISQNKIVTPELLKSELDDILGRKEKKELNVIEICSFIELEIIDNTDLDKRTKAHYKVLVTKLRLYEGNNNITLTTDSLNREHYLGFQTIPS